MEGLLLALGYRPYRSSYATVGQSRTDHGSPCGSLELASRYRRQSKDYEGLPETIEALVSAA